MSTKHTALAQLNFGLSSYSNSHNPIVIATPVRTLAWQSPDKTRTYHNRLCRCLPAAVLSGFAQKVPKDATRGSEVAAACGRARQPNEWQRSVCNAGVSSPRRTQGTATGAALSLTAPAPKATLPGTPPGAHFRYCYTRFRCIKGGYRNSSINRDLTLN